MLSQIFFIMKKEWNKPETYKITSLVLFVTRESSLYFYDANYAGY